MRLRVVAVLVGFAVAVGLRVVVGGAGVAQSYPAALVFAACLLVLAGASGTRVPLSRKALLVLRSSARRSGSRIF